MFSHPATQAKYANGVKRTNLGYLNISSSDDAILKKKIGPIFHHVLCHRTSICIHSRSRGQYNPCHLDYLYRLADTSSGIWTPDPQLNMFNLKDHQTKTTDVEDENGYQSPETGSTEVIDPESGVKRGLKNRHLSMMALAGIIGPGLLVGAGGALQNGGPASLLIGFGVIGIIAFSIMQSLGEITTLYPGGGSFISLAERMVDKGFSVAVGWVSVSHNPK